MKFCTICENMMVLDYSEMAELPTLLYTCKKCGHHEEAGNEPVSSMTFEKRELYESVINPFTKFDPTLPRILMKCIKPTCENHEQESEIIYIRYDNVELKYAYLCPLCDSIWKNIS